LSIAFSTTKEKLMLDRIISGIRYNVKTTISEVIDLWGSIKPYDYGYQLDFMVKMKNGEIGWADYCWISQELYEDQGENGTIRVLSDALISEIKHHIAVN